MDEPQRLRGSCSCGRYHYVILIPENDTSEMQLHFATDSEHRRSTASLLSSYLRVPLRWYASQTFSLFPDETHHSISKTFTPPHSPHSQRKFCGYCGTHLSYWTEEPRSEQEYLHINVGSLSGRDLDVLDQLGLIDSLSDGEETEAESTTATQPHNTQTQEVATLVDSDEISAPTRTTRRGQIGDLNWFEEMMSGSRLGRTSKTRKGMGRSADGSTSISWEISEYTDSGESSSVVGSGAKRKIGDVAVDDDTTMS